MEVSPFRLVQSKPGEGLEHLFGDASKVPPLEPGVVLHTHTGQRSYLGAAQSGDSPIPSGRKSGLLGGDLRSADVRNSLMSLRSSGVSTFITLQAATHR